VSSVVSTKLGFPQPDQPMTCMPSGGRSVVRTSRVPVPTLRRRRQGRSPGGTIARGSQGGSARPFDDPQRDARSRRTAGVVAISDRRCRCVYRRVGGTHRPGTVPSAREAVRAHRPSSARFGCAVTRPARDVADEVSNSSRIGGHPTQLSPSRGCTGSQTQGAGRG
jgi:hypothetical protein